MLKYTVRLKLLPHRRNKVGLLPIYVIITINREERLISTGHHIDKKYWDEKEMRVKDNHQLATTINADITTRRHAIIKRIVEYQIKGKPVTAEQIKREFSRGHNLHNIFEFAEEFRKEVQHKRRPGTLENYRKHLLVVESFHGSRQLAFEEIDHSYLVEFEEDLRAKVGDNYIYIIFKTLKTFFNAARKRGIITCYPFTTYENPEYSAPVKDYLTLKELDQVEQIADAATDKTKKQTCVYFLLGCYAGLRLSDWLQFNFSQHVKEGRIYLRAKKNGEWVTMPIAGRLKKHIARVKATPLQITEQEMNRTLKDIARDCKIRKRITTHTGRHTFAITMCAEKGISAETCAELMGITIKTCVDNYYRVTGKKIEAEVLKAWK